MAEDSPEEAARKRMLARMGEEPSWKRPRPQSTEEEHNDRAREREEAKARMRSLMGDSARRAVGGVGAAFGAGSVDDDEDYGYGAPRRRVPVEEIDLATGKPLKDPDEEQTKWNSRHREWSRKPELGNPNPSLPADTLREPGQAWRRQQEGLLENLRAQMPDEQ